MWFSMHHFLALLLGLVSLLSYNVVEAQPPEDLLAIEELADKNYINRYYNTWEYPYYFLPNNRPGRHTGESAESKSLPIMEVPVKLSNPIINLISRANKFYRMIRANNISKKSLQQSISTQRFMA